MGHKDWNEKCEICDLIERLFACSSPRDASEWAFFFLAELLRKHGILFDRNYSSLKGFAIIFDKLINR